MVIVKLQDGTKINFAKTPTPQDIDFAYKKIQAERARKAQSAEITDTDEKGGFQKTVEKVADFTGGKEIGQGLGQALANATSISETTEKDLNSLISTQSQLLKKIKDKKAAGENTDRLQVALDILSEDIEAAGGDVGNLLNQEGLTTKEVLGDTLQVAATVAGAGTYGKATQAMNAGKIAKTAPTAVKAALSGADETAGVTMNILKGAGKGALKTGAVGAVEGAVQGAAQGIQDNGDVGDVLSAAGKGAAVGGVMGIVLGGVTGGISGGIKGKKLTDAVVKAQEESGIRPTIEKTIQERAKTDKVFASLVGEAKKQGYSEREINFLATVNDADKPVLQRMFDITAKAQTDPRQITRAADILGDNATNIVRQVQEQNRFAGSVVDEAARGLKGQTVDATSVRKAAYAQLRKLGVTVTRNGEIKWGNSVFKKTSDIQKKLALALSDLPDGEADAFKVHNFKRSIDEVVDYGVSGEGLKGRSASLLKQVRRAADQALDAKFDDYNAANTEFKATQDFLDKVREVVGKKVDFNSEQSAQSFGQAFRSAFSNNKSRPKTLALIEELQNIAKARKLNGAEQNLLDQAIYVNILEEQFGSQAATGLANEVKKGVQVAKGAVRGFKDANSAFEAVVNVGESIIEKARNITPEAKKDLLQKFLQ